MRPKQDENEYQDEEDGVSGFLPQIATEKMSMQVINQSPQIRKSITNKSNRLNMESTPTA